jgi:adenine-specific DNA-methyltransferase
LASKRWIKAVSSSISTTQGWGKKYLQLWRDRAQYQIAEELDAGPYNDLYTFFSPYYGDGDFISKRGYGRRETYAIP